MGRKNNIYDISEGWPIGISDGLTLDCGICDNHTDFDYNVTRELWEDVVPDELKRGVLCLRCLDKLAKENGYFLGNHLNNVQYTGIGETVVLKPKITFVYEDQNFKSQGFNKILPNTLPKSPQYE